jgi:hypothetical protein
MTDTRPMPQGTIYVCQDCMLAHANGEASDDRPADLPEVWALWENEPAGSVTMGSPDDAEFEIPFSDSTCDGCGDRHAGDRYAFTYWA